MRNFVCNGNWSPIANGDKHSPKVLISVGAARSFEGCTLLMLLYLEVPTLPAFAKGRF